MRKRSSALHADSEEEFKCKLKLIDEIKEHNNPRVLISAYTPVTKFSAKEILELHEKQKRDTSQIGFDFKRNEAPEGSPKSQRRSSFKVISEGNDSRSSILSNSEENGPNIVEKKLECMVIGSSKVGKHFLINSCFEEPHQEHHSEYTFDMMVKSKTLPDLVKRYHFWIYRPNNTGFDTLIKTYYKKVNLFVFVFDCGSHDSFMSLEEAINKIRNDVFGERLRGILVGNNRSSNSDRKVLFEEAEQFRVKHNLLEYLEIGFNSPQDYDNLSLKLDQYLLM